jgi:hypothetical protein
MSARSGSDTPAGAPAALRAMRLARRAWGPAPCAVPMFVVIKNKGSKKTTLASSPTSASVTAPGQSAHGDAGEPFCGTPPRASVADDTVKTEKATDSDAPCEKQRDGKRRTITSC